MHFYTSRNTLILFVLDLYIFIFTKALNFKFRVAFMETTCIFVFIDNTKHLFLHLYY